MKYSIAVKGWLMVVEAKNKREATRMGRELAEGVSLLYYDVSPNNVRLATEDDIAWFESMGGSAQA